MYAIWQEVCMILYGEYIISHLKLIPFSNRQYKRGVAYILRLASKSRIFIPPQKKNSAIRYSVIFHYCSSLYFSWILSIVSSTFSLSQAGSKTSQFAPNPNTKTRILSWFCICTERMVEPSSISSIVCSLP